jgi:hypothetical protein
MLLLSTSHAAWVADAVHGVHAMYSARNLGTAVGGMTSDQTKCALRRGPAGHRVASADRSICLQKLRER